MFGKEQIKAEIQFDIACGRADISEYPPKDDIRTPRSKKKPECAARAAFRLLVTSD